MKRNKEPKLTTLVFIILAFLFVFFFALPQWFCGWSVFGQTEVTPPKVSNKVNRVLYLKDLGVPGDSTDVTTALNTVFNSAAGAIIYFDTNKVYYVTDEVVIPEYATLEGRGSKLNLKMGGAKTPLSVTSGCSIKNLTIDVDSSTAYSGTGDYGCGIRVGQYVYNGTITSYHNITLEHLTITTERRGGVGIEVAGEVENLTIRDIIFPPDDSMGTPIQVHWGMDTSTTDTLTYIPRNIIIENIQIDTLKRATSDGIYLSGVMGVTVRNAIIESPYRGIVVYGGDYGLAHADPAYIGDTASLEGYGVSIENCRINGATVQGIKIDGSLANVAGYLINYPIKIDGCEIVGTGTANTGYGITVESAEGVIISRTQISKHRYGILGGSDSKDIRLRDCKIFDNNYFGAGVYGLATNLPAKWIIDGCDFYRNSLADTGTYSGVYIHVAGQVTVSNCYFGDSTTGVTEPQRFGIQQSTSADHCNFYNNMIYATQDQGVLVRAGYNTVWNNKAVTGITLYSGTPTYDYYVRVDTSGTLAQIVTKNYPVLQEGTNMVFTLADSLLTINGPASAGTADSMGIDTDGDGVVDNFLYSAVGGSFHLKKGSDITLTVTGDTVTIAGPASAGTADSIGVDTDGDLVANGFIYASGGPIGTISEKTGMIITIANDTVYLSTTLGTTITTDEVTDSTLTGADISVASNLNVARLTTSDSIRIWGDINLYGGTNLRYFKHRYVDPSGNQNYWTLAPTTDSKYKIYSDSAANLMVFDARNDRIGILDLTPSYTLDVTGNGQFTTDLIIGDDMSADSGYFTEIVAGGQNIDNDTSITSEGECKDLIGDSLGEYSTTAEVSALIEDSLDEYPDTVALNDSLATIRSEMSSGDVTDAVLTDSLNRYFDTVHVNDSLALLRVEMRTADSLYGDANSYAFYRNDTLFKYVGGQFSYEYYDGTTIVYEVTGAGLSYVDSANKVTDGNIDEADLYSTNAATDNYILSFDDATGGFTWVIPSYADSADEVTDGTINLADLGANSVDSTKIVAASISHTDLRADLLGNFIDSTSVDTIQNAHKAVLADSATNVADGSVDLADHAANSVDSTKIVNASIAGADLKADILGNFIDSTTLDTIGTAHKAVLADSAANVTDGSVDLADHAANSVDSTKIVNASIAGADLKADILGNFIDTTSVDTIQNAHKAVFADSATNILDGGVDAADLATDIVDSTKVGADKLSITDINWTYEWVYLTEVYGFNRALSDSIYLYDNVAFGDTLLLLVDSAGNITANDQDTVRVGGYVLNACIIDSLEVMYMTGAELVDVYFNGPTLTTPSNLCDSNYWTSATDLTSAAYDTAQYAFANDVSAVAGDRFSFKYIVNYGADNERLRVAWIRIRVKR